VKTCPGCSREYAPIFDACPYCEPAPRAAAARRTDRADCPQCKGELVLITEYPERGTGCIVMVLGLILAPFVIGIGLLIWGLIVYGRTRRHWHCRGCGRTFPA
jgi:uncharacterized protein YbaR (Trm112 family)